jgi:hypothetical protein
MDGDVTATTRPVLVRMVADTIGRLACATGFAVASGG